MRIALLSDIHSNLEALRACLDHAASHGAGRFAFLGDLVGYGADPCAVVDLIADQASRGAIVVKGNHDQALGHGGGYLNDAAASAIRWTREQLESAQRDFLDQLPLCVREEDVCFVHASADRPERWEYVDSAGAAERSIRAAELAWTFAGHVHEQMLYRVGASRKAVPFRPRPGIAIPFGSAHAWLAIVGSVGQPRDGNPAAGYALADTQRRSVVFHRVAYDHYAAARKVRNAGLPLSLSHRLERGA